MDNTTNPDGPFFTEAVMLDLEAQIPGVLDSTVLKVPHHGSESSSSPAFLEAVSPQVAVARVRLMAVCAGVLIWLMAIVLRLGWIRFAS